MADSNEFFLDTCRDLLERMINTVPKTVKLGDPIDIIPVKPSSLYASVGTSPGMMNVTGFLRLVSRENSFDADPGRKVKLHFRPRSGEDCSKSNSCVVAEAAEFSFSRSLYHQGGYPYFKKYKFNQQVPIAEGVSAFDVEVIDTQKDGSVKTTMHTNGRNGFPFDDTILTQPDLSCVNHRDAGLFNLTVAVGHSHFKHCEKRLIFRSAMMRTSTPSRLGFNCPNRLMLSCLKSLPSLWT